MLDTCDTILVTSFSLILFVTSSLFKNTLESSVKFISTFFDISIILSVSSKLTPSFNISSATHL